MALRRPGAWRRRRSSPRPDAGSAFLRRAESQPRVLFLLVADVPWGLRHEDEVAVAVAGEMGAVELLEFAQRALGTLEPPGGGEGRSLQSGLDLVFGLEPRKQHLELELADDADDPLRADIRVEHLDHPFFRQVV